MAIVENEGQPLQNRDYRQHLNRNWDNINGFEKTVNKQIKQVLGNPPSSSADEVTQLRIDTQGNEYPLAKPRVDSIERDASYAASEVTKKADKDFINSQLSQMTSAPEYVQNTAELVAKYPQGGVGLYVTADTNTKFIWSNGKWVNVGVYPTQGIANGGVNTDKLTPNTSSGMLITAGPVTYDPVKRSIRIPDGNVSVHYQGDKIKWVDQRDVVNLGYGGFIIADVSGERATLSYKEGADFTQNDVIIGGIFADNLNLNASIVASESSIPASASVGTVITGSPVYLDNNQLIFDADTSFINKKDYFVMSKFKLDVSNNSGFFIANAVFKQVRFVTGDKLHDGSLNADWFIFGGIMNGNLYINGSYEPTTIGMSNNLIIYLGDSITVGFRTSNEIINNYPTEVNKINHVPFERYAVTGSTITAPQDGNAFVERAKNIDFSKATEVVIFGGHNDYKAGRSIGDITSRDETTVLGALNVIVAKIYSDNPKSKIRMISPNWRVVKENDSTSPNDNDIDVWKNSAGLMFKDYVEALNKFAKANGFPILNLRDEWAVNKLNQTQWLVDGLHPNDAGQQFLGETVARFLA
ncbi:SGNH/GDSL hydrolase family protein [Latilactobacillus sakei subsp. sakei]|uniref:SGNH/GDSL hydrolase family protein n=1 Tax=Latilactobacillus sakei TaxID=1599 RepID=UPI002860FEF0|nr:SGNH/GDSL hydrolase family protein [Latilactobacillus sakei]MDR7924438.1 SGNH/GDSL hydrolase family protein [Latilactobacillus sakei subsp. sakei]